MRTRPALVGLLLLCACSGQSTSNAGSGGSTANGEGGRATSGGAAGHGNATGGAASGGAPGGGVASGGVTAGGARNQGGTATAGAGLGGATNGGAASGVAGGAGNLGGSGAGGNGDGGSAGGDAAVSCVGATKFFPEFDRTCQSPSECVLVAHTTSCCGALLIEAIAASEKSAFDDAEAICDAQYPPCGCASFGAAVEDGTQVSGSWQTQVRAECDAGRCKAHNMGPTFSCGTKTCVAQQYCSYSAGGPQGSEPSYTCVATTCSDCACLNPETGCSCSAQNGHLLVSCQRP